MVATLSALAEAEERENVYVGAGTLQPLLANLQAAEASRDFVAYLEALQKIADRNLQLGRVEKSIELQLQANQLLKMLKEQAPHAVTPEFENDMLLKTAVKYLRQGESENCIHCRTGESCILPIKGSGVHSQQRGSRGATHYLMQLLERNPDNMTGRWLLNIAAMTLGEYPHGVPEEFRIPPEKFESEEDFPRFANVAAGLGIATVSLAGGAVAGDFDGDHHLDILTSDWHPAAGVNYLHNEGNGSFAEKSSEANLDGITGGLNMMPTDYNNDGHLDVLVLRGGWLRDRGQQPNSLLRNDGTGRFTDVTYESGLAENNYPTQTAAWADFDIDGDLDLYVGNEYYPCQLFENDGKGHFSDIAAQAGVENKFMAKGVVFGDFNDDRYPDIYVSNLGDKNRLYRNNQDGTFIDVADDLGVSGPLMSFPVWFWDYNNDGALDLYVSTYNNDLEAFARDFLDLPHDRERPRLYEGDGRGGFREVAEERHIDSLSEPMGCNYGDLDNDGYLDFYLGTGYPAYQALMPNVMYLNKQGEKFADVTFAGGFGHLQKGHGVAFADFDHDGDQDVFSVMGGAYAGDTAQDALFENPGFGNNWLKIRLIGQQSNRAAIGARIKVTIEEDGQQREIYRWITSGSSFGGNPLRQEIGIGQATAVRHIEIYWPMSDITQNFTDVPAGQLIEITEGDEDFVSVPLEPTPLKIRNPELLGAASGVPSGQR